LVAALGELVLARMLPAVTDRYHLPHAFALLGAFARNFSGVLCVLLLAYALGLTLARRDLFGAPLRVLFALVGVVLTPLLGWAAVAPVPPWLASQVETSFIFLALACVYGAVRTSGDTRTSAGLAVLTLPLLARAYSLAAGTFEVLAFGRLDAR